MKKLIILLISVLGLIVSTPTESSANQFANYTPQELEGRYFFIEGSTGKELRPSVKTGGIVEAIEIPGYKKVNSHYHPRGAGHTVYVYEKIQGQNSSPANKEPLTQWVDEDWNDIKPKKNGNHPAGQIPGYRFEDTIPAGESGIIYHIFTKEAKQSSQAKETYTHFQDENGKDIIPKEKGFVEAKKIDGYKFLISQTEPNQGYRIHKYEKTNDSIKVTTTTSESSTETTTSKDEESTSTTAKTEKTTNDLSNSVESNESNDEDLVSGFLLILAVILIVVGSFMVYKENK